MKILARNIPLKDNWITSTILNFDDYIKIIYDVKISNDPNVRIWEDEYLEFESEEDYFLFFY